MTSRKSRPDLAISDGLVVTPSSSPSRGECRGSRYVGGIDEEFHGATLSHVWTEAQAVTESVSVLLPLAVPGTYSYLAAGARAQPGDWVVAPLGPRQYIGVVWENGSSTPEGAKLRELAEVLDHEPLSDVHRRFIDWVADYYLAPKGSVLRMCLRVPAALGPPRMRTVYRLTGRVPGRPTAARLRVLERLKDMPALEASEIAQVAGVGTSVVKGLAAEGVLEPLQAPAVPPFAEPDPEHPGLDLTTDQKLAAAELRRHTAAGDHAVMLLDGVTGSGKTEVYFEAMAEALVGGQAGAAAAARNRAHPAVHRRVEERFGVEPAQWHSGVRPRERERVWRAVATGEARIVVGRALGAVPAVEQARPHRRR